MYYAILSEADVIEVFPDEQTRSAILCYYYDIEFESIKLDIDVSHRGELEEWVEKEYPGIRLEFANPSVTQLQIENHRLRKQVDERTLVHNLQVDFDLYNQAQKQHQAIKDEISKRLSALSKPQFNKGDRVLTTSSALNFPNKEGVVVGFTDFWVLVSIDGERKAFCDYELVKVD